MTRFHHNSEYLADCLLNEKGYPLCTERVALISRDELVKIDFNQALKTKQSVGISCFMHGKWEILGGVVERISSFCDGTLIFLIPQVGDFCRFLPLILIWIPDSDNQKAGMLY